MVDGIKRCGQVQQSQGGEFTTVYRAENVTENSILQFQWYGWHDVPTAARAAASIRSDGR